MRKIIYLLVLTTNIFLFSSCESFLSEVPTKGSNQPITEIEQLEALLENTSIFMNESGNNIVANVTDDYDISTELYDAKPSQFRTSSLQFLIYNEDMITKESSDMLWDGEYKKIYNANLIINNLKNVSGSEADKAHLKAEAHFVRAYSYWVLANTYCLPFSENNFSEPGLPKKLRNDYDEDLTRMTLKDTYDFIESDLNEALKIDDRNISKRWRASRAAVYAFMSRYRLFRQEYELAVKEADEALKNQDVTIIDYASLKKGKPAIYGNPADTIPYSETNDYPAYKYVKWNEFYYTRFINFRAQWYNPSQSLIKLYDQENDYRFINFFMPNSNRRFSITGAKAYRYTTFSDGSLAFAGPAVGEILLNKAEALCRMGKDLEMAKDVLFMLQMNRVKGAKRSNAKTQLDLLLEILNERRRECPFSMRFYDIKRYSVNETKEDDVEVVKNFYEVLPGSINTKVIKSYTLPVGSRKYAFPINDIEIMNSRNQIKQNTY